MGVSILYVLFSMKKKKNMKTNEYYSGDLESGF
jgi:hypothetical protein